MARSIPLSRGLCAIVDDADYEALSQHTWHAKPASQRDERYYACTKILGKLVYMHRFLMKPDEGLTVDHINGDGIDNRRGNLRLASRSQNNANRVTSPNSNGYRGVGSYTRRNKTYYRASVGRGAARSLGRWHSDPALAAQDYDAIALARFGDFARLNFPRPEGGAA